VRSARLEKTTEKRSPPIPACRMTGTPGGGPVSTLSIFRRMFFSQ
jgi:hypothetical protein